jgi:hypothetical protein
MATWKILGQGATTSTARSVVYTNGTTNGVVAWAVVHNRSTATTTIDLWVATSTGISDKAKIIGLSLPAKDTLESPRFTMSTGDSVIWDQTTTGLSISVFGSEGISTA